MSRPLFLLTPGGQMATSQAENLSGFLIFTFFFISKYSIDIPDFDKDPSLRRLHPWHLSDSMG